MSNQEDIPSEPESPLTGEPENDSAVVDIDAALASVASLSDVLADQEAEEAEAIAQQQAVERAEQEAERRQQDYYFPYPAPFKLQRGQLASVGPAVALIGVGAWLTFTMTSSEEAPSLSVMMLVVAIAFAFSLFSYWASTERWSQGAMFGALMIVFGSTTIVFLASSDQLGVEGWPLLVSAGGAALSLSALMCRVAARGYQVLIGFIGIVSGLVGLAVTTEFLGAEITELTQTYGPFLLIALVILLLLPTFSTRQ